jgi:hypothetical protein
MTDQWVPSWDDSFQQANLDKMHAAGFRVLAGYVAGGTSDKWSTPARVKAWLAYGDTGFMPLFEGKGREPVDSPSLGMPHAKAARSGARLRGIMDSVSISPAVDTDVSMAQVRGNVASYMRAWKNTDTVACTPYIEGDGGLWLFADGLTLGTFVPAAYDWNDPAKLYTPANAASHMMALQEHNGRDIGGGNVDIGHVRVGARCVQWAKPVPVRPKPPVVGHAPGSRTLAFTPVRKGYTQTYMTGPDVEWLQEFIGPKQCGKADGVYGGRTAEGVSWYEEMRRMHSVERPYGVAGAEVWRNMGVRYTGK